MKIKNHPIPPSGGSVMKFFCIFSLISCPVLMAATSVKSDYSKSKESKYTLKLSEIKITTEKQYDILYYQNILFQQGEAYIKGYEIDKKNLAH